MPAKVKAFFLKRRYANGRLEKASIATVVLSIHTNNSLPGSSSASVTGRMNRFTRITKRSEVKPSERSEVV